MIEEFNFYFQALSFSFNGLEGIFIEEWKFYKNAKEGFNTLQIYR